MKFNWINKGMNKVLNKELASAYRLTPEWELYTSVVTTSLNNSFYEQAEESLRSAWRMHSSSRVAYLPHRDTPRRT